MTGGRAITQSQGAFVTPIVTNNPVFQVKILAVDDKLETRPGQSKPIAKTFRNGDVIRGNKIGGDNKKDYIGTISNIKKGGDGNIIYYTIHDDSGQTVDLDPSTISMVDFHDTSNSKIDGENFYVMESISSNVMNFVEWKRSL
jgi:hypothetical protein